AAPRVLPSFPTRRSSDLPVITTREAETSAIVKTGHTVVIGGLIGETQQAIESGVPILKDVPLLGYFFRSRSLSRERTEIAIFLRSEEHTSELQSLAYLVC